MIRYLMVLLGVFGVLETSLALSETSQERGLAIFKKIDAEDAGFKGSRALLTMTLINKAGARAERVMQSHMLEIQEEGKGDLSINRFLEPPDIKDIALLSHENIGKPDNQWLYLPAYKKIKRIASRNKSGSFQGSEFSYEDLASFHYRKYTYNFLREENHQGKPAFVVERFPTDRYSGYSRQTVWVDKEINQVVKVDYYDRREAHLKTALYSGYKKHLGKFWRMGRIEMSNHQTGKKTILEFRDWKLGLDLKKREFTPRALESD